MCVLPQGVTIYWEASEASAPIPLVNFYFVKTLDNQIIVPRIDEMYMVCIILNPVVFVMYNNKIHFGNDIIKNTFKGLKLYWYQITYNNNEWCVIWYILDVRTISFHLDKRDINIQYSWCWMRDTPELCPFQWYLYGMMDIFLQITRSNLRITIIIANDGDGFRVWVKVI